MAAAMSRELRSAKRRRRPSACAGSWNSPGCRRGVADVTPAAMLEHMRIDKKVLAGRLRLVLLRGIGEAFVTAEYPRDGARADAALHTWSAR